MFVFIQHMTFIEPENTHYQFDISSVPQNYVLYTSFNQTVDSKYGELFGFMK